jgi:hypothetical protein
LCGRITRLPTTQRQEWPIGLRRSVGETGTASPSPAVTMLRRSACLEGCASWSAAGCAAACTSPISFCGCLDEALVFRSEGCDPLLSEACAVQVRSSCPDSWKLICGPTTTATNRTGARASTSRLIKRNVRAAWQWFRPGFHLDPWRSQPYS